MIEIRAELDVSEQRQYSLVDYRHGHSYAVIRGFPEIDDEDPRSSPGTVMDLFFAGVERISCWKDIGQIRLRKAGESERSKIEMRIGRIRASCNVYLLEDGSIESYVLASRVYWAEFDLPYGAPCPIASDDHSYRDSHPPVDGFVRFAD